MSESGPSRHFSPRVWFAVFCACALIPFVFVLVQGYMASLLVPALLALGVSSPISFKIVIASWGVLGAPAILCFPLGWIERGRPALLGAIVGVVGCLAVAWIWFSASPDGTVWSLSQILELGGLFAGCIVFAVAGAAGARRVAA